MSDEILTKMEQMADVKTLVEYIRNMKKEHRKDLVLANAQLEKAQEDLESNIRKSVNDALDFAIGRILALSKLFQESPIRLTPAAFVVEVETLRSRKLG